VLQIRDGRHPVLEQSLVDERFVPNDTQLGVAASVPLAVEPGVSLGGMGVDNSKRVEIPGAVPGGRMPPSTAGRMPAATWWRCADAPGAETDPSSTFPTAQQ
jgi:hypothetical protein